MFITEGSHAKLTKSEFSRATFIPTNEKIRVHTDIAIKIEQERFESYQGMMALLKKGF